MAETRKVTPSGSVPARCQERERTRWTLTLVAPDGVGQLQRRVEPAHLFDDLPGLEGQLVRGGKAEALEGRGEEGRKSKERKKPLSSLPFQCQGWHPPPQIPRLFPEVGTGYAEKVPNLRGEGRGLKAADPCLNLCQEQIALGNPLATPPLGSGAPPAPSPNQGW